MEQPGAVTDRAGGRIALWPKNTHFQGFHEIPVAVKDGVGHLATQDIGGVSSQRISHASRYFPPRNVDP
jgi:hypothetical protein